MERNKSTTCTGAFSASLSQINRVRRGFYSRICSNTRRDLTGVQPRNMPTPCPKYNGEVGGATVSRQATLYLYVSPDQGYIFKVLELNRDAWRVPTEPYVGEHEQAWRAHPLGEGDSGADGV